MNSLFQILKENTKSPKAIILAGAPGAGKGYVLKGLDLTGLKTLNLDNHFIKMLKDEGISLDLKKGSPESRSKAAQAMANSNTSFKQEVDSTIDNRESFVLDGTAASVKNTDTLKKRLEDIGYDVFMLYVYTDLERSLKQNQERFEKSKGEDRSLLPGIVMKTWESVTKNYSPYKEMFGENFVSVSNTLNDGSLKNLELIIKTYLDPFKVEDGVEKDEKSKIRSQKAKDELNASLKDLLTSDYTQNIINSSSSKEEAQSKIKSFLSK